MFVRGCACARIFRDHNSAATKNLLIMCLYSFKNITEIFNLLYSSADKRVLRHFPENTENVRTFFNYELLEVYDICYIALKNCENIIILHIFNFTFTYTLYL